MMLSRADFLLSAAALPTLLASAPVPAVRRNDFRGVWIQTVLQQRRFAALAPKQCEAYFTRLVELLRRTGFNAVVFQVRSEGDAFFPSPYEPWSRYLTGVQGKAPAGGFDPLRTMVRLCHERKMELHAWLNPYRMSMSGGAQLAPNHLYRRHPEWFVSYASRLYLDPGLQQSRSWIRTIVKDIVTRYPVDAIHMDDYFYPYPAKGQKFADDRSYAANAGRLGVDRRHPDARGEFRRRSVNALIDGIHRDIAAIRPGCRFGISPFGIYRNRNRWAGGSQSNGIQCYDDLYADVLLWARSGWVDYLAPQLYWEIGNRNADFTSLCSWWAANVSPRCRLYIGQSIERSLDARTGPAADLRKSNRMFTSKLSQVRNNPRIAGQVFWYGYQIEDNAFGCRDFLSARLR